MTAKLFRRIACILLMLYAATVQLNAQPYTPADSISMCAHIKANYDSVRIDPQHSLKRAQELLAESRKLKFTYGIAKNTSVVAYATYVMGDVNTAFKYYNEALALNRQYGFRRDEGKNLYSMSTLYHDIGDNQKAFEFGEQALKIAEEVQDSSSIANCYSALGIVLAVLEFREKSIEYYTKAAAMYHQTGRLKNEGIIYNYIAAGYTVMRRFDEARPWFQKAMQLNETPELYANLGAFYGGQDKDDSALYYFTKALDIYTAHNDKMSMAVALDNVGKLQGKLGKLKIAEENLLRSLALAKEVSYLETIWRASEDLSYVYALKQDYRKAYDYHVESGIAKDSLYNMQSNAKIAELTRNFDVREAKAQTSALQKENSLQKLKLQRKNLLIYGALAVLLALVIITVLLVRQGRLKAAQQATLLEQKQLRAQMNPHFIFNCLNSIQHFVVSNDVKNANKYLSGFASLMRQTLENSKESSITLAKEIAYLDSYVTLERMRHEDKFTYRIHAAEDISTGATEIPPMIIQPFVENAIRHGLCYLDNGTGHLDISFYKDSNNLYCKVDDNGIGRERSQSLKKTSAGPVYESQGMELTRRRLELVSRSQDSEYTIQVVDKQNTAGATGTTIIIKFPLTI